MDHIPLEVRDPDLINFRYGLNLAYVILAAAGGAARYLYGFIGGTPFRWSIFIAHIAVSAFSGVMFAQFGTFLGVKAEALYMFAGMGGFMGTQALEVIQMRLKAIPLPTGEEKPKDDSSTTAH